MEPIPRIDQHLFQVGQAPFSFREPEYDAKMFFTLTTFCSRLAGKNSFDDIFDIADIETVTGRPCPVDLDDRLRNFSSPVNRRAFYPPHAGNRLEHLLRFPPER